MSFIAVAYLDSLLSRFFWSIETNTFSLVRLFWWLSSEVSNRDIPGQQVAKAYTTDKWTSEHWPSDYYGSRILKFGEMYECRLILKTKYLQTYQQRETSIRSHAEHEV